MPENGSQTRAEESYELDLDDTISHLDEIMQQAVDAVEKSPRGGNGQDGKGQDGKGQDGDDVALSAEETPASAARVAELEAQLQGLQDRLIRTLADFDNFRKRAEREKEMIQRYALFDFLKDFLGVQDNLERALAASGTAEDLKTGVEMIARQVSEALRRSGAEPVEAMGRPFDPAVHEAVSLEPRPDVEAPTVIAELQRGYRFHDRLLRPAMVNVAMPVAKPAAPETVPPETVPPETVAPEEAAPEAVDAAQETPIASGADPSDADSPTEDSPTGAEDPLGQLVRELEAD